MSNVIYEIEKNIKMLHNFENFIKINKNNLVFVCVGNSDVWYDSFGPIVGTLLKDKYNIPCFVYGNLYNNIKLSNLNSYIKWINKIHFDKKIVVIDAALTLYDKNKLILKHGGTKCAYYSNTSEVIGDYSILCPIKEDDLNAKFNYENTINNSLIIASIIYNIYNKM